MTSLTGEGVQEAHPLMGQDHLLTIQEEAVGINAT